MTPQKGHHLRTACCPFPCCDSNPGRPWRMSCEKAGSLSAARAAGLMWALCLSSAKGKSPAKSPRSYIISSPFPLRRMRQSHLIAFLHRTTLQSACMR